MIEDAEADAATAGDRAGIEVRELIELADLRPAMDLFCRVWGVERPDEVINLATLRAMAHAGNYIVGGYRAGELVGAVCAFLGIGHLHSHLTGVRPGGQGAGVGYVLKLHQRAWSLRRGIPEVRWTYDPLIRRNAYFNLHKLGARATEYLVDFYGPLTDGINTGDATDRLYVRWDLAGPDAVAAAQGKWPEPDRAAAARLVEIPPDIEALRVTDPAAAARWRQEVRAALVDALSSGLRLTGITRDGHYVLAPAGPPRSPQLH